MRPINYAYAAAQARGKERSLAACDDHYADSFFFVYLAKLPKAVSVHGDTKKKKKMWKKKRKTIKR